MTFFSYALIVIAAFGAAVYLVMNGHPWFALLILVLTGCISFTNKNDEEKL